MKLARADKILAIKNENGEVFGFHSHNLQVARLAPEIWSVLKQSDPTLIEASEELEVWNNENDPDTKDSVLESKIRSLSINVTQICNLRCTYCGANGDGTYGSDVKRIELPKALQQVEHFLKDVKDGEAFRINFIGGEPLIYPEGVRAIAEFARQTLSDRSAKLTLEIITNATLITPEITAMLAQIGASVVVSFDGPPSLNDKARVTASGRGSSEKVLDGIRQLFSIKPQLQSLGVNAVFGSHQTNVLESYLYLRSFPWDMMSFSFASSAQDETFSPLYTEQMAKVADAAFAFGGEPELRRISQFDQFFKILDSKTRIHNYCGAGKSLLQIDTSGNLYACNWFANDASEIVGNGTSVNAEKLRAYADPLNELNGCKSCWAKHMCGGGCMFVHKLRTGNKHKKDIEFCTRTKNIIAKGIEYYAQAREHKI